MSNPVPAATTKSNALRFTGLIGDVKLVEQQIPPLPVNEILIKVHAASINPIDVQLWRNGLLATVKNDKGLGRDFSGTIIAVGHHIRGYSKGDEVYGLLFEVFGQGTFSEYIHIDPSTTPVAKKPTCFTHEAASTIPLAALSAFACLDWLPGSSTPQRRLVVRGASGGTGSMIVQLAKLLYDCHVTAICSAKNSEYVKKLGADVVIDYTSEDIIANLIASKEHYNLVVDCVGGNFYNYYYPILKRNGAYVTLVGNHQDVRRLGGPITYARSISQIYRFLYGYICGPRYAVISFLTETSLLDKVSSLAERGELHVEIQEVIASALSTSPSSWEHAVSLIESTRIRGKVVLSIS